MPIESSILDIKDCEDSEETIRLTDEVPSTIDEIWQLLDTVWDEIGCDGVNPDRDKIDRFYRHPVWQLNGLFIEQHELSMQHRRAISDWIGSNRAKFGIDKVVDYGGGFGTLAKLIAQKDPGMQIDILEPYPIRTAKRSIARYPNIRFVNSLNTRYDCLVSLDVLEHVYDPLNTLADMVNCLRPGGLVMIANNFYPVIKCHLPGNFHFRYTFRIFSYMMGLRYIGQCHGTHAGIYRKVTDPSTNRLRLNQAETLSKVLFPYLKTVHSYYKQIKKAFNQ